MVSNGEMIIAVCRRTSPFRSYLSETIRRQVGDDKQKKVLSIRNVVININFDNRDYLLNFFVYVLHMCDEMKKRNGVCLRKQLVETVMAIITCFLPKILTKVIGDGLKSRRSVQLIQSFNGT